MAAVRIRSAQPELDADAIARLYAPYVRDEVVSFELEPPSASTIAARVIATQSARPCALPWLVLELEGELVAYAYASRLRARPAYDWVCETSIYVARERHGAGLGARLYTTLLDLLTLQGFVWAYGAIALPNPASVAFHARLGFEHLARFPAIGFKHGQWCDIDWWRKALRPLDDAPKLPRSLDDPELAAAIAARIDRTD